MAAFLDIEATFNNVGGIIQALGVLGEGVRLCCFLNGLLKHSIIHASFGSLTDWACKE